MRHSIQRLQTLSAALKSCSSIGERIAVLDRDLIEENLMSSFDHVLNFMGELSEENTLLLKSLIAIEQHENFFRSLAVTSNKEEKMNELFSKLLPVEQFYHDLGGIVGYHLTLCLLLKSIKIPEVSFPHVYHRPFGIDISQENNQIQGYVKEGIFALPYFAEIFPVGGAADRLRLCDPQTQLPLPAAKLPFCGRTLLEGLIRDVAAKEYLYYKVLKKKLVIPIAMMTSHEKDNHRQILAICEENHWFGRPRESFRLFCQPLVPTIDTNSNWCLGESMQFLMKPGGHGVIWKLAEDQGVFDWLESQQKTKLLIRQINNPIASVDYGILAFCGIGFSEEKVFGFASCLRQIQSAEGVNVLIERKVEGYNEYCMTNIEYCDFKKYGIQDDPQELGSQYSQYPSNTNILFADLAAIREKVKICPIPGMLVNLKKVVFTDVEGNHSEQEIARLESMMQNIADCFVEYHVDSSLFNPLSLNTFLTYQSRQKTISTTKKEFQLGGSLLETPEGCYYDLISNAYDLLANYCHFSIPSLATVKEYLEEGPSFIFHYHPGLGPFYHIIAQKLSGGGLSKFSELELEIAEIKIENLQLNGSFRVLATHPIGENVGRCRLINVSVNNQGIDRECTSCYWDRNLERKELCEIIIQEDGEFDAENITLEGNMRIEVKPKTRVKAYSVNGRVCFDEIPIDAATWDFEYEISTENKIQLNEK